MQGVPRQQPGAKLFRVPHARIVTGEAKLSRIFLVLLLLALLVSAYVYYAPFRLITLVAAGRSPVCPFREALQADSNLGRQVDLKDKILNASRLVDKDLKGVSPLGDAERPILDSRR